LSALRVLLCWGCGGLPWARHQPAQLHRHQLGSLGSWVALSASGPRFGLDISRMMPGESPLCLSSLLHAQQLWLPAAGWLGRVQVEVVSQGSPHAQAAPALPSLEELSGGMAAWCEDQLGEPGVLAVPAAWRELPLSQRLLGPWGDRGWRFIGLEPLVERASGGARRVISSDGPFLRLHGPVCQLVLPAGLEAAGALSLADDVLERMLHEAGPTVASYWRQYEQQRQELVVKALLARKIMQALHLGAHALSLGGSDAPLFFEPGPGAPEALRALPGHRFQIMLPRLPALDWWSKITEPGFLRSPTGRVLIFGLDWKGVPTVEIEGPSSPWDLPSHLEAAGADRGTIRAHALHDLAHDAGAASDWFPERCPPEPASSPAPGPAPPSRAAEAPTEPSPAPPSAPPPIPDPEPPSAPPPMEPPPPTAPAEPTAPPPAEEPPPLPTGPAGPEPPPPPTEPPPLPEPVPAPVEPPPLPEPVPAPVEPPPLPAPIEPPPLPEPSPAPTDALPVPAPIERDPRPAAPARDIPDFSSAWEAQRGPSLPPPPSLDPAPTTPAQPPRGPSAQPTPPPPPGTGLAGFDPQRVTIRPPHRPESLRLLVDGEPIAAATMIAVGQGPDGRGHYLLEGCALHHGALVRVDFEPDWGEP
jgi:hypothetical protein